MSGSQIRGFLEATRTRLAEEFKAPPQFVGGEEQPYTVLRIQGVPVVRWEYTTEVPDGDPQANVASGVAFLVPSRDTLDIISFNSHKKDLATARELSEQVLSTLKVPLTIDAESFGGRSWADPGVIVAVAVGLLVLLAGGGFLWWRRSSSQG
jgi:hypothetical protein